MCFLGWGGREVYCTGSNPADGTIVRGSESLPHRQISDYTPGKGWNLHRGKNRTAEAVRARQPQYAAFGCGTQQEISQ